VYSNYMHTWPELEAEILTAFTIHLGFS